MRRAERSGRFWVMASAIRLPAADTLDSSDEAQSSCTEVGAAKRCASATRGGSRRRWFGAATGRTGRTGRTGGLEGQMQESGSAAHCSAVLAWQATLPPIVRPAFLRDSCRCKGKWVSRSSTAALSDMPTCLQSTDAEDCITSLQRTVCRFTCPLVGVCTAFNCCELQLPCLVRAPVPAIMPKKAQHWTTAARQWTFPSHPQSQSEQTASLAVAVDIGCSWQLQSCRVSLGADQVRTFGLQWALDVRSFKTICRT